MSKKEQTIYSQKVLSIMGFVIVTLIMALGCTNKKEEKGGPFMATGIKIGEVTQTRAIIWTRLTQDSVRVGKGAPMPSVKYIESQASRHIERKGRPDLLPMVSLPENATIEDLEGAVPGAAGRVRLKYWTGNEADWSVTDWVLVDSSADYTKQFELYNLVPGTPYQLLVEAKSLKSKKNSATIKGKFKTAPSKSSEAPVNFVITTGTSYPDIDSDKGYKMYLSAMRLKPDFFVHTGDNIYYDGLGKNLKLARWHWNRINSLSNHIKFHRQIPSYFIKDDHDTWMNNCYPGMRTKFMGDFTFEQGKQVFLDEVPMGDKTYRTVRWGKDLQIWMMEGRDFRDPNIMPDSPEKTIWGKEQMEWFKQTVSASDATFKVLINPTPIVGPVGPKNDDNHASQGFRIEGRKILDFISKQSNMYVVCGDNHHQYVSKDIETNILEFSCGAASKKHAGGWDQENVLPEHLYLNVTSGFLECSVSRENGVPHMVFRHYSEDGDLLNEHALTQ